MAFVWTRVFAIWAFMSFLSTAVYAEYVIHERRSVPLSDGVMRTRLHSDTVLPMRIALRPNDEATSKAEDWLMGVSDPDSPEFGKFWSQDEVIEAFRPKDDTVEKVTNWLSSQGIQHVTHSDNKQWLAFPLSAGKAEALLKTRFFGSVTPKGRTEVSCDYYSLPEELLEHIDFVKPGIKVSDTAALSQRGKNRLREVSDSRFNITHPRPPRLPPPLPKHPPKDPNSLAKCDKEASPACIRALYHFSALDPNEKVCKNNSMGVFEEEDLYYQGDINSFTQYFTNIPNGTAPIDLSVDGGQRPPDCPRCRRWREVGGESNLDISVSLPIIYPQNVSIFQTDDRYYSHAVDYGEHGLELFNDFLDAIDGSYCTYSAYNETGNDPKHDPKYPDPHKGGYKGKLQCGVYKAPNVVSMSYGGGELRVPRYYAKRQCNEYLKLGLQGVSIFVSSGDFGSSRGRKPHGNGTYFFEADETVNCPWITGVGATQIGPNKTVHDPESAASDPWAGIVSGGGFSNYYEAPAYQKKALQEYFKVSNNASDLPYYTDGKWKGNDGLYNRNGRGVPDIAALGSNVAIWFQTHYTEASGTSASAPLVAALFNRIVEERIRAGKRGRIGLVNPTLYKNPQMLNDIIKGNNGATVENNRVYFGPVFGYNCTEGWDPVTGLGTPNYPEMLKVFMDLP